MHLSIVLISPSKVTSKYVLLIASMFIAGLLQAQALGRLENEYKLAVPDEDVEDLWVFLKSKIDHGVAEFGPYRFTASHSDEFFEDVYFDTDHKELLHSDVGLRYRKRYINNLLEKELIQLKAPTESSDLVRTENKYSVDKKKNRTSQKSRHPFLKYVKSSDRDKLDFELKLLGVDSKELGRSVELNQRRRRLYLSDSITSIATITLDQVKNELFPYQEYTEMELELNEVRYTQEDSLGRSRMDAVNKEIKKVLFDRFKNLEQDQTPKYNKMYALIENNTWSILRMNWANICYIVIVLLGVYSALTIHSKSNRSV